jgi:hypothetical protein
MSDQDKFEAQGRAHAALRAARSNVATLTVALREFSQGLRELSQEIEILVADPARHESGAIKPQAENLGDHLRRLDVGSAAFQLAEICREATKARLLEAEIAKF